MATGENKGDWTYMRENRKEKVKLKLV